MPWQDEAKSLNLTRDLFEADEIFGLSDDDPLLSIERIQKSA